MLSVEEQESLFAEKLFCIAQLVNASLGQTLCRVMFLVPSGTVRLLGETPQGSDA